MFKERFCKQCRHIKFMGSMKKWPVQKQTHRTTLKHVKQYATDIQINVLCVVFRHGIGNTNTLMVYIL